MSGQKLFCKPISQLLFLDEFSLLLCARSDSQRKGGVWSTQVLYIQKEARTGFPNRFKAVKSSPVSWKRSLCQFAVFPAFGMMAEGSLPVFSSCTSLLRVLAMCAIASSGLSLLINFGVLRSAFVFLYSLVFRCSLALCLFPVYCRLGIVFLLLGAQLHFFSRRP